MSDKNENEGIRVNRTSRSSAYDSQIRNPHEEKCQSVPPTKSSAPNSPGKQR